MSIEFFLIFLVCIPQFHVYVIMGNCCRSNRKPKRKIILLLVGLDNAGKTVAVKGLAGENQDDSIPTVGFSVVNLTHLNYSVHIYDLGGGENIRGIWHRYFIDAHGVIFVIDASDVDRFEEVTTVLEDLLSHEKISGKPLLILANKQDNQEALDEIDIVEKLDLERLVNDKKCPTLVESCSATELKQSNKIDPGIEKGYHWLLNYINKEYESLNKRVELDVQEQKIVDERIRKEKIQRLKMNTNKTDINEDILAQDLIVHKDPFRPIQELVNGKFDTLLIQNDTNTKSPTPSTKSINSYIQFNKNGIRSEKERPKSALQIVKRHLEISHRRNSFLTITSNKTTPLTLLSPKSAPVAKSRKAPDIELDVNFIDNFRSASKTGQILTVTELPNAIIDANGENIGDLFELNNFTSSKKLPPLRKNPNDEWTKPIMNSVNVIQDNIDEIYKDIS